MVFVTKYRYEVFADRHLQRLEEIMRAVRADFGTDLVEFDGEADHVHLLVNFPPEVAVSKLVNSLKGISSRRLRQEFPDLVRHYYRANRRRSGSYFAGSVGGAPLSVLRRYIEQQNRPVQSTPGPGGPPAWAFTPAQKGGAPAHLPVAAVDEPDPVHPRRPGGGQRGDQVTEAAPQVGDRDVGTVQLHRARHDRRVLVVAGPELVPCNRVGAPSVMPCSDFSTTAPNWRRTSRW